MEVGGKLVEIPKDVYPGGALIKGTETIETVVKALKKDPKAKKDTLKSVAETTKDALKLGLTGGKKTVVELVDKSATTAKTVAEAEIE